MNKFIKLKTYRIAGVVCALCGGLIGHGIGSMGHESELNDAYDRGYKDASWFVTYDVAVNPTVVTDNLGRTWYRIDSTDTMPAVDRLPIIIPDTGGVR